MEIRDPTKPMLARELQCAPMSFDAAMNQDMPKHGDEGDGDGNITPRDTCESKYIIFGISV